MNDEFYIGYLPKAPVKTARFVTAVVVVLSLALTSAGIWLALGLPYFGKGEFEFGHPRDLSGSLWCGTAPELKVEDKEYLLVGQGKKGVGAEICSAAGSKVSLRGTMIRREDREVVEVEAISKIEGSVLAPEPEVSLGRFTLTGEIVDSKCYFGVMNPAEGRAHRACAVLCLRGGVPAVFVARDRSGAIVHLLLAGLDGKPSNASLLRWVGESVEASGDVFRQGQWLVWHLDPAAIQLAGR